MTKGSLVTQLPRSVPMMSSRYALNDVDKVFQKFIDEHGLNHAGLARQRYMMHPRRGTCRSSFEHWLFKQGIYVKVVNKIPHFEGCSDAELTMFILRCL